MFFNDIAVRFRVQFRFYLKLKATSSPGKRMSPNPIMSYPFHESNSFGIFNTMGRLGPSSLPRATWILLYFIYTILILVFTPCLFVKSNSLWSWHFSWIWGVRWTPKICRTEKQRWGAPMQPENGLKIVRCVADKADEKECWLPSLLNHSIACP